MEDAPTEAGAPPPVGAPGGGGGTAAPPVEQGGGGTTTPPPVEEGGGGGVTQAGPIVVAKTSTSKCTAKGPCSFKILVTNTGDAEVKGPIVIDEQIGAPGAALAAGPNAPWTCTKAAPFSCTHPGPLAVKSSTEHQSLLRAQYCSGRENVEELRNREGATTGRSARTCKAACAGQEVGSAVRR